MTSRHEFLAMLHERLKPRGYLEIGVFSGDSLRLVHRGTPALGIDPDPHLHGHFPGTTQVARTTSDNYFETGPPALEHIDLAFIDGMHLFEYALRDYLNIEQYANPRTVVVLDDVLPRNQHEAAREQCPGDWTGDVWKVPKLLESNRPRLHQHWVDTSPTGTYVVYGFEEAIGSSVGTLVRDKDGITAALAFARLVADEKRRGRTVLDRLDDLARELGVHATGQRSIRVEGVDGLARMQAAVDALADSPPATLAGAPVGEVVDLRLGRDLPPTDGVVVRSAGLRLIVRPSGTEPKLKCYAEAVVPVRQGGDLAAARAEGSRLVAAVLDDATGLVG